MQGEVPVVQVVSGAVALAPKLALKSKSSSLSDCAAGTAWRSMQGRRGEERPAAVAAGGGG